MQLKNGIELNRALPAVNAPELAGKSVVRGRKDERMIVALLEHSSVERAAAALGVSEATLWRRLKEPSFQEAFRHARREAFSRAVARLQQASSAAVTTVLRMMCDTNTPPASRLRAATSVLELTFRATELEDLQARIQRLEDLSQNSPDRFRRLDVD